MRAFRPSQFGRHEDVDDEAEQVKLVNLQQYAQRAQEGLPLFESRQQMPKVQSLTLKHVR